ncbi:MAG: GIY-YIG nuclease family protein [Pleurocapsa sp. SU_5_0]|nr:GIY-YIG nuclease family protein [Pleurocapsa sp. SU_5_0]NJO94921.1 GIY-YIG nuclease family protein [Pleurocapsa sp. CRU_1_2]NJR47864.1 GIY-YIG nuclease family protein [Hyellaceae cyanobacterium CSU_1_1]
MESNQNQPLEHQNVPIAHQGLHSFLYSSEGEHSAKDASVSINFDGTEIVEISVWEQQTKNSKVAGVYAVLDSDRLYQYIGYSRDVQRSLKGHITQNGTQVCSYIRVKTFKFPKRQAMEALRDEWLAELNYLPAGNTGGNTWASTIGEAAKATMSESERNAYEEKKLKLRKAMADTTLIDELETQTSQSETELQRRQKLEAAVKNDDWSSVIESQ